MLLAFYALLKYSIAKQSKKRLIWVGVCAAAVAFVMQLHTITLIGVPIILVIYLFVIKKRPNWKDISTFVIIAFLLFLPLISNDLLTRGENTKAFYDAVINQQDANIRTTIPKQSFMNGYNFVQFYTAIVASNMYIKAPIRLESSYNLLDLINKNASSSVLKNNFIKFAIVSIFFVVVMIILIKIFIKKSKEGYFKEHSKQYNFIILLIIWQSVFALLFYPLALKVDSRYFLSVLFIPIILIGFCFLLIEHYFQRYGKIFTAVIIIGITIINIYNSVKWILAVNSFSTSANLLQNEMILEDYYIVTNKQWQNIIDVVVDKFENEDKTTIYIDSSPMHIKPFMYLLRIDKNMNVREIDAEKIDNNGVYFYLREAKKINNNKILPTKIKKNFIISDTINFGTVVLFELQPINVGKSVIHESKKQNNNRCYMQSIPIQERAKCRIKDLTHLFNK
jgi:hypothetical protein